MKTIQETFREKALWKITKYTDADAKAKGDAYETKDIDGNLLTNEGINELLTILGSAASGTKYDNTNAYLIVGTGVGAAAAGDTEATFTAGVKAGMEVGYPTYGTSQQIIWKASFDGDTANQAWNEFGVLNASSAGKLLNRKVETEGTKTLGQVWDLELQITLS